MKKRIKKLLCYSFLAFISTSINFDVEARLPKYMAQRAAELLIEKSGLVLKEESVANKAQKRREFAEKLVNFLKENIASQKGKDFAIKVLTYMRTTLQKYQEETGNIIFLAVLLYPISVFIYFFCYFFGCTLFI